MISSEEDLWPAIQSALHGLHALHQAGLVHRDIRWKNILKLPASNGSWMLIDLETVWKTDCTPSCWLRAWDDNTLVDGVYTRSSDLYLVGRLMESFRDLSPEAKEFQAKLLRHEFLSAQEALRVDGNGKYSFSSRNLPLVPLVHFDSLEGESMQELEDYAIQKAEETTAATYKALNLAEEITSIMFHQISHTHDTVVDIDHELS
ncbi:uncharacterized protein LOC112344987 [Selaginella moellendorffii]|uniref:uncharacterized protein LOC112344987 n=1 Tax=Selaginella moellendorffii TaxID=88036 RepID=UPI000D1C3765|nr:uncharacterized protein LOC112344987 [Selaginella moellendorffii]|eukprot:XP_024526520.1 uncharacterized protein LOC112344987 [Selaginella moellendorffii]